MLFLTFTFILSEKIKWMKNFQQIYTKFLHKINEIEFFVKFIQLWSF